MNTKFRITFTTASDAKDIIHDKNHHVADLCPEEGKKSSFVLDVPHNKRLVSQDVNAKQSVSIKQCAQNDSSDNRENNYNPIPIVDNETNKDYYMIEKPAHIYLSVFKLMSSTKQNHHTNSNGYIFGGLEIVSNSRNIEAYTTDKDGKESYLLTSRGAPLHDKKSIKNNSPTSQTAKENKLNDIEWHSCIIVHPNGPSEISNLKLKLLSLRSPKFQAIVKIFKLKGKLPPDQTNAQPSNLVAGVNTSTNNASNISTTQDKLKELQPNEKLESNQKIKTRSSILLSTNEEIANTARNNLNSLNQDDIKAAMTTITMMSRSMEVRIETTMKNQFQRMLQTQNDLNKQMKILEHQNKMLQNIVTDQGKQIQELLSLHQEQKKYQMEQQKNQIDIKCLLKSNVESNLVLKEQNKEIKDDLNELKDIWKSEKKDLITSLVNEIKTRLSKSSPTYLESDSLEPLSLSEHRLEEQFHNKQTCELLSCTSQSIEDTKDSCSTELTTNKTSHSLSEKKSNDTIENLTPDFKSQITIDSQIKVDENDECKAHIDTSDRKDDD